MGQYYKIVNIDKKEYINPFTFGDGLKLMELSGGGYGVLAGLAILLADGNGRGGGDLYSENEIIGSWAGNRIVMTGDYADPYNHLSPGETKDLVDEEGNKVKDPNLYDVASLKYKNISFDVLVAMADDDYVFGELKKDHSKIMKDLQLVKNTEVKNFPTILESLQTEEGENYVIREIKDFGVPKRKKTAKTST